MIIDKQNAQQLFYQLDDTTNKLIMLVSETDADFINKVPFENSWTVAQLAVHITKSNKAIAQGLGMPGNFLERDAEENVPKLKNIFLDFTAKYQSPPFIAPEERDYNKEEVITELNKSIEQLHHLRTETNLTEIISLPIFGEITKLELLHFVLYHTQRHIRQLKNILAHLEKTSIAI